MILTHTLPPVSFLHSHPKTCSNEITPPVFCFCLVKLGLQLSVSYILTTELLDEVRMDLTIFPDVSGDYKYTKIHIHPPFAQWPLCALAFYENYI